MKCEGEAMADGQYFLEYNIGHQLCSFWNSLQNNAHRIVLDATNSIAIDIVKMLTSNGVTLVVFVMLS